ncbi:glycosyltransferase family 4 protein [Leptothoe sp. LEGE 181152]|nr:glycosyltransferase family 4 protein [Leptothoe sp. LEGE 181152]
MKTLSASLMSSKDKILESEEQLLLTKPYLLITGDFVKTGGMDRANYALASYLARTGCELHLVAYRVAPELIAYKNVTFHKVSKPLNSYLLGGVLLSWFGKRIAAQLSARDTRVIVNGGNCQWGDVNWVHYVHAAYRPTQAVSWLQKIKAAMTRQRSLRAEKRAIAKAKIVVSNSQRTKQDLTEKVGASPTKVHCVYYGIDTDIFKPATSQERELLRHELGWSSEGFIGVFIGALGDRRKGFDTLFDAWKQLCQIPNWDGQLMVIGSGAELPIWRQRLVDEGIESHIQFLGFRDDVPNLLRAADCLIAPTRYEAYGLGVHEALCCGLPTLVSQTAGVAERYLPELEELKIVDLNDSNALKEQLCMCINNLEHFKGYSRKLSSQLRKESWDVMAKKILTVIETAR